MKIEKSQRNYTDYRLDRSEDDFFFYNGRTGQFEWNQAHFEECEDGSHYYEIVPYSLNESDYWHDKKLVKEIKEFKKYVNNQISKGV